VAGYPDAHDKTHRYNDECPPVNTQSASSTQNSCGFPAAEKIFEHTHFRGLISGHMRYLWDSSRMSDSSKTNEFLHLLMANQKRIYTFILALVPNHQDADDLFQETVR
jgi:hypothetical protein